MCHLVKNSDNADFLQEMTPATTRGRYAKMSKLCGVRTKKTTSKIMAMYK